MITLHKLNGDEITLNADLIISVEANPDTLISLLDRRTMLVSETVDDVIAAAIAYRRAVFTGQHLTAVSGGVR